MGRGKGSSIGGDGGDSGVVLYEVKDEEKR